MAYGVDIHPDYQRDYQFSNPTPTYFWLKVSDGSRPYTRVMPDALAARGRSKGIPAGGYHWAQPVSRTAGVGAAAQALILMAQVQRLGLTQVVPALDLEDDGNQYVWPAAEARGFISEFVRTFEGNGKRVAVYMNGPMASKLGRAFTDNLVARGVVIWFARYGNKPEAPGSAQYLGHYDVHQYSSTNPSLDKNESYTNRHLLSDPGVPAPGPSTKEIDMTRYEVRAATGAEDDHGYVQVEPGGRADSFIRVIPGDAWIIDTPADPNTGTVEQGHFELAPVFIENLYHYGVNGEGMGNDPGEQGGIKTVQQKVETIPTPNVARTGIRYSANAPFVIVTQ